MSDNHYVTMKHKCDKCDKPATVHLTEIVNGQKNEKHLCEDCAAAEGVTVEPNLPISKLLEEFVAKTSGGASTLSDMVCPHCGISFLEFRQNGLLGCPKDYEAFENQLIPLLGRMHAGADHHTGKAPKRAASAEVRHNEILRLRAELKRAVNREEYELAAELRDTIKKLENEAGKS